jgi:NAD+ kinase
MSRPRVLLLGSGNRANLREHAGTLRPLIEQHAEIVLEDLDFERELGELSFDLVIVLGGDGSILRVARQMGERQVPVLGVNLGKLGFLADLSPQQFQEVFPDVCRGEYHVVEHLMLECRVLRGEDVRYRELGLNEMAVLAGPPYRALDFDLYVDSEMATTYSCDGLIIGTPVGSTAHSLSAGGPILRKDLQAFVISPISPHTLTVRPVIDAADRIYDVVVGEPGEHTSVVIDGKVLCRLTARDRVSVRRAAPTFQLVEVAGHTYYRTLREKLGWRGSLRRSADQ